MKFVAAIASLVVITLVVASCSKRDYACNCYYKDISGMRVNTGTTVRGTKTTAENACRNHQNTLKYANQTDVTCFLQ
ncbi:MAG: hypothetical protein KF744_13405 [Taibaiella sp.]|nr:hypothetical protein [Taibaiella sp.]